MQDKQQPPRTRGTAFNRQTSRPSKHKIQKEDPSRVRGYCGSEMLDERKRSCSKQSSSVFLLCGIVCEAGTARQRRLPLPLVVGYIHGYEMSPEHMHKCCRACASIREGRRENKRGGEQDRQKTRSAVCKRERVTERKRQHQQEGSPGREEQMSAADHLPDQPKRRERDTHTCTGEAHPHRSFFFLLPLFVWSKRNNHGNSHREPCYSALC